MTVVVEMATIIMKMFMAYFEVLYHIHHASYQDHHHNLRLRSILTVSEITFIPHV